MKHARMKVVSVLSCQDGVKVAIKQPRVVDAIRERDTKIAQLHDRLLRAQSHALDETRKRNALLTAFWTRLGIALRMVHP